MVMGGGTVLHAKKVDWIFGSVIVALSLFSNLVSAPVDTQTVVGLAMIGKHECT